MGAWKLRDTREEMGEGWARIPTTLRWEGSGHLEQRRQLRKWDYFCVHPPILRGVHCNKKGKRSGGQRKKEVRSLWVYWLPALPGVPSWVWSPGLEAPWLPMESILEHIRAPLGFCFYNAGGGCPS